MERFSVSLARLLRLLAILVVTAPVGCDSSDFFELRLGTLEVTTSTVGVQLDSDGYQVRVVGRGNNITQSIGINQTLIVAVLEEDVYSVGLEDVAANCAVENSPRDITIVQGVTSRTTFLVTCG